MSAHYANVQPMQIVSIIWVAYPATLWQPLRPNQEHKRALENFISLSQLLDGVFQSPCAKCQELLIV